MRKVEKFIVYTDGDRLIINNQGDERIVNFVSKIEETQLFDQTIVVRLHPKGSSFINENIFGVSYEGKILWQIEPLKHVYDRSPYTGIFKQGDLIKVHNWDGADFLINPNTGDVIKESYSK